MTFVDDLRLLLNEKGDGLYGREAVTQKQHALQCAACAQQGGAGASLITAALLHDIGHLLDETFEASLDEGVDRRHEDLGCAFLQQWFGEDVSEPVRLHVDAKRYLAAVDGQYLALLSSASLYTLNLQGGRFSADEVERFIGQPFAREAVRLRLWDDQGKDPEMDTPAVDHFLEVVASQLRVRAG